MAKDDIEMIQNRLDACWSAGLEAGAKLNMWNTEKKNKINSFIIKSWNNSRAEIYVVPDILCFGSEGQMDVRVSLTLCFQSTNILSDSCSVKLKPRRTDEFCVQVKSAVKTHVQQGRVLHASWGCASVPLVFLWFVWLSTAPHIAHVVQLKFNHRSSSATQPVTIATLNSTAARADSL